MRLMACTALVFAACQGGTEDRFPIVPGGDYTPISPPPDAAEDPDAAIDGATSIMGRVCVVTDLRNLTLCTLADASGITVTLGTSTAVTAIDGTFTIAAPQGTNLAWRVTAVGLVPSVVPLSTTHVLPVVSNLRYNEMLLDNGIVLSAGDGSVFARVVRNGAPAVGVTAAVDPPSLYGPLYDGGNAVVWAQNATGAGGVVWIPDVPLSASTLTLTATDASVVIASVPTIDGAITFATVAFP